MHKKEFIVEAIADDKDYDLVGEMIWQLPVSNLLMKRKGELIRCKDCRYFELNHFDNINGIPMITAHEICTKWCGGCKTSQDGYCFMAERKEQ